MKKTKIFCDVKYEDHSTQKILNVYLDYSLSKEMCLTLMLLYQGVINSLEIELIGFSISFRLNNEKQSYCSDLSIKQKKVELSISRNALGLIVNFLLKYYRDGIGEAKHVDLDFKVSDHEEFTLTFVLDKFKMLSHEEMEQFLKD